MMKKYFVMAILVGVSALVGVEACETNGEYSRTEVNTGASRQVCYSCRSIIKTEDKCAETFGSIAKVWVKLAKVFGFA